MKNLVKKWEIIIVCGTAIVLIAFFLRIYSLTLLPIFADEAIYIRWAQVMKAEPTMRFVPLSDGKQPLFMWSMIPFLKLASDPLFAGRFFSVLIGIGTLVGIFFLTYLLFKSKKIALIAGLIYSLSPFSLFFDRMALVDSLLSFFGVWTLFFASYTALTLRLDTAMIAGFSLGGAFLTKSPALFFALLLPTTWLLADWSGNLRKRIFLLGRLFLLLLVIYFLSQSMYNILRLGPNFQLISQRNQDYVFPLSHLWTNSKDPFIFHIKDIFNWFLVLGPWPIIALFLIALIYIGRSHYKEKILILLWFAFPILVQSEFAKVFTARYILFSVPFLIIFASTAFLIKKGFIKKIALVFLFIFILLSIRTDFLLLTNPEKARLPRSERSGYLEEWTAGTGIKEVASYLKNIRNQNPGKTMVVGTEGYFGTLPDGLQIYLNEYPEIVVKGVGLDIRELNESLMASKKWGNNTYLVVNSSRFKGDAESLGLTLLEEYPKAKRPDGFKEYVVYGPQDRLLFFEVNNNAIN